MRGGGGYSISTASPKGEVRVVFMDVGISHQGVSVGLRVIGRGYETNFLCIFIPL